MPETIDVHDLPEEQAHLVQEFVEFLREKLKASSLVHADKEEKIQFAEWPLEVKGKLTREEIYDYL